MLLPKRTLLLFNVEYEMKNEAGEDMVWKANLLTRGNQDDAINFITKFSKKPVRILSISNLASVDGLTDAAVNYIVSGTQEPKRGPGRPPKK